MSSFRKFEAGHKIGEDISHLRFVDKEESEKKARVGRTTAASKAYDTEFKQWLEKREPYDKKNHSVLKGIPWSPSEVHFMEMLKKMFEIGRLPESDLPVYRTEDGSLKHATGFSLLSYLQWKLCMTKQRILKYCAPVEDGVAKWRRDGNSNKCISNATNKMQWTLYVHKRNLTAEQFGEYNQAFKQYLEEHNTFLNNFLPNIPIMSGKGIKRMGKPQTLPPGVFPPDNDDDDAANFKPPRAKKNKRKDSSGSDGSDGDSSGSDGSGSDSKGYQDEEKDGYEEKKDDYEEKKGKTANIEYTKKQFDNIFETVDVAGDGNCFFHSMHILNQTNYYDDETKKLLPLADNPDVVSKIDGDGNCFFSCLKHIWNWSGRGNDSIISDHEEMREKLINYLETKRAFYEPIVMAIEMEILQKITNVEVPTFELYIEYMRKDGSYGEALLLLPFMEMYEKERGRDVKINVWQEIKKVGKPVKYKKEPVLYPTQNVEDGQFHLYHIDRPTKQHFDMLEIRPVTKLISKHELYNDLLGNYETEYFNKGTYYDAFEVRKEMITKIVNSGNYDSLPTATVKDLYIPTGLNAQSKFKDIIKNEIHEMYPGVNIEEKLKEYRGTTTLWGRDTYLRYGDPRFVYYDWKEMTEDNRSRKKQYKLISVTVPAKTFETFPESRMFIANHQLIMANIQNPFSRHIVHTDGVHYKALKLKNVDVEFKWNNKWYEGIKKPSKELPVKQPSPKQPSPKKSPVKQPSLRKSPSTGTPPVYTSPARNSPEKAKSPSTGTPPVYTSPARKSPEKAKPPARRSGRTRKARDRLNLGGGGVFNKNDILSFFGFMFI